MSDIYKDLATAITGRPAEDLTNGDRAAAKAAFWATLQQVAQLPGNEPLRIALGAHEGNGLQFANLTWQSRWNDAEAVAAYSTDGPDAFATGFMGVLKFRLDRPEDVRAIAHHARMFANMVERAGREFGTD